MATRKKAKTEAVQPPQVKVVWRGKKPPPSAVTIGMLEINDLPDEAAQRAGFEHEHATDLAHNIRDYKVLKAKG